MLLCKTQGTHLPTSFALPALPLFGTACVILLTCTLARLIWSRSAGHGWGLTRAVESQSWAVEKSLSARRYVSGHKS